MRALAYVFWHRPARADDDAYEADLQAFHSALAASAPPGLRGSVAYRLEELPFGEPGRAGYEDWYLVGGSADLDPLNEAAVTGERKAPHDLVAHRAAHGAGGLYGLVRGEPAIDQVRFAAWLAKPDGSSYADFYASLEGTIQGAGASLWRRHMVLSPAPEFTVRAAAPLELAGALLAGAVAPLPV